MIFLCNDFHFNKKKNFTLVVVLHVFEKKSSDNLAGGVALTILRKLSLMYISNTQQKK